MIRFNCAYSAANNVLFSGHSKHSRHRDLNGKVLTMEKRKKRYSPKSEYLDMAKGLTKRDTERLMARMRGRFARRLEDKKFTPLEAVALQLEFEDEQLKAWRKAVAAIRKKEKK